MPLFGSKTQPVPANTALPPRHSTSSYDSPRRGFFSRRRSSTSSLSSEELNRRDTHRSSTSGIGGGGGIFHRRSTVEEPTVVHRSSTGGGLFHRNHEDPSIAAARQRVMDAEAAEREADRALHQARAAVRGARDQVKVLEKEAAEEARLARVKQQQAANISKRAKPLGRHGVI